MVARGQENNTTLAKSPLETYCWGSNTIITCMKPPVSTIATGVNTTVLCARQPRGFQAQGNIPSKTGTRRLGSDLRPNSSLDPCCFSNYKHKRTQTAATNGQDWPEVALFPNEVVFRIGYSLRQEISNVLWIQKRTFSQNRRERMLPQDGTNKTTLET